MLRNSENKYNLKKKQKLKTKWTNGTLKTQTDKIDLYTNQMENFMKSIQYKILSSKKNSQKKKKVQKAQISLRRSG